jgi:hypothetical protein
MPSKDGIKIWIFHETEKKYYVRIKKINISKL